MDESRLCSSVLSMRTPAHRIQPPCNRTPEPTNRRIGDMSYKTGTDNTRKNKFCRNKTSTYLVGNEGVCPLSACQRQGVMYNGR